MESLIIYLFVASVGATLGFMAAVLMMGAKIADRNDQIFYEEVKRRIEKLENGDESVVVKDLDDLDYIRGRRKLDNTNSVDNELM